MPHPRRFFIFWQKYYLVHFFVCSTVLKLADGTYVMKGLNIWFA